VILKIVPKACHNLYTGENRPMTEKQNWNENFDAAFGAFF
jgi:hypothetical protein